MVQSRNTTVDYTVKGISYMGLSAYGKIMVGNRAFEFIMIAMLRIIFRFPGTRWIPSLLLYCSRQKRFHAAVMTKSSGTIFSPDNKGPLRGRKLCRQRADGAFLSFLDVTKRSIRRIVHRKRGSGILLIQRAYKKGFNRNVDSFSAGGHE